VVAAVTDEETLHPGAVGQPRHPHVEIHPVDALDLEHRVSDKTSPALRATVIIGLRFGRAVGNDPPTATGEPLQAVHTPDRHVPTRVFIPFFPALTTKRASMCCLSRSLGV
jgi:hypothetical protein